MDPQGKNEWTDYMSGLLVCEWTGLESLGPYFFRSVARYFGPKLQAPVIESSDQRSKILI